MMLLDNYATSHQFVRLHRLLNKEHACARTFRVGSIPSCVNGLRTSLDCFEQALEGRVRTFGLFRTSIGGRVRERGLHEHMILLQISPFQSFE